MENNKRQTAVEFLHSEYKRIFENTLLKPSKVMDIADALTQAKEIEKKQIIDAYIEGVSTWDSDIEVEQYYNETYGRTI